MRISSTKSESSTQRMWKGKRIGSIKSHVQFRPAEKDRTSHEMRVMDFVSIVFLRALTFPCNAPRRRFNSIVGDNGIDLAAFTRKMTDGLSAETK